MNEEKLIGYIKGEIISEAEIVEILDWIESSTENQKSYTQIKNLWVLSGLDHPDQVQIPPFAFPETNQLPFHKTFWISFLKYAAIFILAFGLGTMSVYFIKRSDHRDYSSLYNTIRVSYGEQSQITLYDGTKVWLNSGTKFRYPVAFSPTTRDVFIEGEAYFEVAKDASHPFVVNAGQLKVQVLGTHFDVCAYPEDHEFSTTLVEGSVNATNTTNGKGVKLNPGEQVILNRETNELKRLNVDIELYTSWKENLLKFEDAPFEEVIKKMERWYDVRIQVDPAINTRERYTMTIKTESLREMLQLIAKTTKIKYEINVNTVLIKRP
ncbi:MAG TPA: FecR domain-containing protein [Prolixibacteraceae bacterium]|jgi:ferric-dicitrate binding protein FerR (iron transport regulator)